MIGLIIGMILSGAVVGALGRLALPGPDPMSFWQTVGVGIGGSMLAGLVVGLLTGWDAEPGVLSAVLGSTFVVWVVRRARASRA